MKMSIVVTEKISNVTMAESGDALGALLLLEVPQSGII
jgi:hypothetical protein